MRVEYINPFVESAFNVLKEVLQGEVKRGELYLKSTSIPVMGWPPSWDWRGTWRAGSSSTWTSPRP